MKLQLKICSILMATAILLLSFVQANDFIPYEYQPYDYAATNECCDRSITFSIDFLLWELRQFNQLVTTTQAIPNATATETEIETTFPDYDYSPGFRLGAYHNLECLCAKVGIIWTRLHTEETTNFEAEPLRTILVGPGLQTADVKSRHDLDYLDLDFSKELCLLPCFSITPHIGVRGWWLTKRFDITGNGFIPFFTTNRFVDFHRKSRETAWGLEGGLWLKWNMSQNLALIGRFGGSVMAWRRIFDERDEFFATNSSGTVVTNTINDINETTRGGQGTFDYYIGVEYDLCYCGFDVLLNIGWEHLYICQLNDEIEYNGLTAGAALSF